MSNCYLCGGDSAVIRDRLRHGIRRDVLRCGACGLVFLEPQKRDLREYYAEEYRKQHSPVLGRALDAKQLFEISRPFQQDRIDRMQGLLRSEARVLEIGCGTGHFLDAVRARVAEVVGIEPNEANARFVRQELGISVYRQPVDETELPEAHFDVIALFHVLEHMQDPRAELVRMARYLRPGGAICIEIPNLEDALLSVYRIEAYSDFWYREPHLFYFSAHTLEELLGQAGLEGPVASIQNYNVLNHANWLYREAPESDGSAAMSSPVLVKDAAEGDSIAAALNQWIQKVDREYRCLLDELGIGDSLFVVAGQSARPTQSVRTINRS